MGGKIPTTSYCPGILPRLKRDQMAMDERDGFEMMVDTDGKSMRTTVGNEKPRGVWLSFVISHSFSDGHPATLCDERLRL